MCQLTKWTCADVQRGELNDLQRKSSEDLWKEDLAVFIEELDVSSPFQLFTGAYVTPGKLHWSEIKKRKKKSSNVPSQYPCLKVRNMKDS